MNREELRKKLDSTMERLNELDEEGALAAPVDFEFMFDGNEIEELSGIEAEDAKLIDGKRIIVTGNIKVKHLEMHAHALVVLGDVSAESIDLNGTMLVLGNLNARGEVCGKDEPHTLTVMGKVEIGRAVMMRQYIMQFLGGGSIKTLVDDEGGGEELLELLKEAGSKLKVGSISDEP